MVRKLMLYGVIAAALAGSAASPAHADQYDFISVLDAKGVSYKSITGMMDLGKETCHELRSGSDVDNIMNYLINNQGFATYEAAAIVVAAPQTMCPDVQWRLQDYINNKRNPPAPPPPPPGVSPCTTDNPPAGCADGSY
jgi:hypothetical protein